MLRERLNEEAAKEAAVMKAVEEAAATVKNASMKAAEEEAIKGAAAKKTADDKTRKVAASMKPVHRTSFIGTAIILLITAPLLITKTSSSTCSAPMMASTGLTATLPGSSAHSPTTVYLYKAPLYTTSSKKDDRKMFGPSRDNNMMHARYEVHVWPNSQPRGGGEGIYTAATWRTTPTTSTPACWSIT